MTVAFAFAYLFFSDKNSLLSQLNIQKTELNIKKRNTRYGGLLLLHSYINLTIKSEQRGCKLRRGSPDGYQSNRAAFEKNPFGNYRKESSGKGVAGFTYSLAWDRSEDHRLQAEMCIERQGRYVPAFHSF